jgi:uncharacterized protein YecE (DUF72 family)
MNQDETKNIPPSPLLPISPSVQVGCQGWNYEDWITKAAGPEVFYPRGAKTGEMLAVYAKAFDTVEVDSTFYAIPSSNSIEGWYKKTPKGFSLSLKLPQEITHERALHRDSFPILEEFCERARELKEKLASVLIQMPPQFMATLENARSLQEFLVHIPSDIRFAIEFRSRDWIQEDLLEMLSKHKVALALVEGQWIPRDFMFHASEQPTADFSYIRWMGARDIMSFDKVLRAQDANLKLWAERLELLSNRVANVYAYFSNFYEGHAPASANKLKRLLGQAEVVASDLESQPSLF